MLVLEESLDFIIDRMATKGDIERLEAKIDTVDNKLGTFEKHEVDKRLQLEVRVQAVEKHLHLKPPVGTTSR